jgi:hypothetical protein
MGFSNCLMWIEDSFRWERLRNCFDSRLPSFLRSRMAPIRNPNHVETFTLRAGGGGWALRVRCSRSSWSRARSKSRSRLALYLKRRFSLRISGEENVNSRPLRLKSAQSPPPPQSSAEPFLGHFREDKSFPSVSRASPW